MSKNYSCGTLLKQIHDIMEKNANNVLREQNLTISQSGVLVLLDEKEGKTASFKELEKDFGVSQPTMVGILNRLVQKDLVRQKCHLLQKTNLEKTRRKSSYASNKIEGNALTEKQANEAIDSHPLSKIEVFSFFESGDYVKATRFFTEFQRYMQNFQKIALDHCKTCSECFII